MGQGYIIKCPHCKEEYEWSEGIGMLRTIILHCNKCGKEKSMDGDVYEESLIESKTEDLHCKCGGTFEEDAPIRCPECNRVISESELKENATIMMWD